MRQLRLLLGSLINQLRYQFVLLRLFMEVTSLSLPRAAVDKLRKNFRQ